MAVPPSLGKYRLLAELGRGGMATVYLAAATGPGGFQKLVVVKELHPELAQELEFRDMFLDEARIAARLSHPNIVQTYEVVEEKESGLHLLVMEYLEGQAFSNTRARLARERKLELGDHVRVIADMLEGLHAAHEAKDWGGNPLNVVHRDVSPHNVFVTYAGDVKVVDFGIAKAATSSQHTRTGVIKGKISYMAPEQALAGKMDRRADIFAAGIMLWEAVASRRMWKDMPDPGILHCLATGAIPKLREFVEPDAILEAACEKALAADPEKRYPTAAAMRADLDAFLDSVSPRPTARAFGELLSTTFAREREKIRATIERQMQSAESGNFQLARIEEQSSGSGSTSTSAATPQARSGDQMTGSGALAIETGARVGTPPPDQGRSRTILFAAGGALIAILLGTTIFFATRKPDPGKPATSAVVATAPPPPVPTETVSAATAATDTAMPSASTKAKPPATTKTTATVKATTTTKPPSEIMTAR